MRLNIMNTIHYKHYSALTGLRLNTLNRVRHSKAVILQSKENYSTYINTR
jgi:hypothetical protein